MKIDVIDISCPFSQADAIREGCVQLPAEDHEPGMCGKLKTSTYGTRDAAQNRGFAYSQYHRSALQRGASSPCVSATLNAHSDV